MERAPVSDELRMAIFRNFQKRKSLKILSFEIGENPGEIIFSTIDGSSPLLITEDDKWIYYEMPSGQEDRRTKKSEFLKEIGFTEPR